MTNGTSYTFRVSATNAVGNGSASTTTTAIPVTVPGKPIGLAATPGNAQVALAWAAPTYDGGSAITDYMVEYSTNGWTWSTFSDGTSTAVSATVTGLTNGTSYTFRVSATNAAGTGDPSGTATATPYTTPDQPTDLSAEAGNTYVRLTWAAPTSDGGSAVTDWDPQYSTDGVNWTQFADGEKLAPTAVVTGLTNGTAYTFRVKAVNAAGEGTPSTTAAATPANPTLTTINSGGNVGTYSSIAIGNDGNPVISYHDTTNHNLKVAACANPTCSSSTLTVVDDGGGSNGESGEWTSIAIGSDGNPVIAYYGTTSSSLKVAACANPTCTSSTITVLDTDGGSAHTSIAIGNDDNPVISYWDNVNGDLKVAACSNPTCTSATLTSVHTGSSGTGAHSSITIGNDGNPIVSYLNATTAALMVAACSNPACSSSVLRTLDTVGADETSIMIGADGNPVISYHAGSGTYDLKVAACLDPTCSSATTTILDSEGQVGQKSAIALTDNNLPVVSYYDESNKDLKLASCLNATCTEAVLTVVDSARLLGNGGHGIAIGSDGRAVISYNDGITDEAGTTQALKVAIVAGP